MTEKELILIIDALMPRIIEDTVREALAEKRGLAETVIEAKDFEIDGILLKFKKPEIVLEVKWGTLTQKEIKRVEEKLQKTQAKNKILFIQDKSKIKTTIQTMDVKDLAP